MASNVVASARFAELTSQNCMQCSDLSPARSMVRCPFTRQAGHPGYGSMPIHPPSVSTHALNKTVQANKQCKQRGQSDSSIRPSRGQGRGHRCSRSVARSSIQRRCISLASLGKYSVPGPRLIKDHVSSLWFGPVIMKLKTSTFSCNTVSKSETFQTNTTSWALRNFIRRKQRCSRRGVPSMPNTLCTSRPPAIATTLIISRRSDRLPTRKVSLKRIIYIAVCAPCNGA